MGRTLYEKVYDAHVVNELSGELPLLFFWNTPAYTLDVYVLCIQLFTTL